MKANFMKVLGHVAIAGFMATGTYLLDNSGLWVGAKREFTNAFTACGYAGAALFASSAIALWSRGDA